MRHIRFGNRFRYHRLLKEPLEYQTTTPGSSSVKSEGEFFQVGLQVELTDYPLLGISTGQFRLNLRIQVRITRKNVF